MDFFHHLLVTKSFKWFWMGIPCISIPLITVFYKFPFLVLRCTLYTLLIFLMMLSVILLCMLLLCSTLIAMKLLIFDNNYGRLLNMKLTCETVWTVCTGAGSALLISVLEKLSLCHLTIRVAVVLLM